MTKTHVTPAFPPNDITEPAASPNERGHAMLKNVIRTLRGSPTIFAPTKESSASAQRLALSLTVGPLLAQAVLIYLFTAAPSLHPQLLFLEADIAIFWLLLSMLKDKIAVRRVRLLAVTNGIFAAFYAVSLFGDHGTIFLPWAFGAWFAGMLHLHNWKERSACSAIALSAFALMMPIPVGDKALSLAVITNSFVLFLLALILYLSAILLGPRIFRHAHPVDPELSQLSQNVDMAEAANGDISRFFAEASHAIRAPLDGIIGYSELLIEEDSALNAQQRDDARRIYQASQELLGLVSGIFDLSEISTSSPEESADTNMLLSETLQTGGGHVCG